MHTRTLKSGEVRMYFNKAEKQKQQARQEAKKDRLYEGFHRRELSTKRIKTYITFLLRSQYNPWQDVVSILHSLYHNQATLRMKLAYTRLWERKRILDPRMHMCGYAHIVARYLDETQARIRFYEAVALELGIPLEMAVLGK